MKEAQRKNLEEMIYEGYGPGGGAILLQAMTANRNRNCGRRARRFQPGRWQLGGKRVRRLEFSRTKGLITMEIEDDAKGEEISLLAIDAGADDVKLEDGFVGDLHCS